MILVTVGTHYLGFERLIRPMDAIAARLEEKVIIQYGSSHYIPRYAEGFAFTTGDEMKRLTAEARLVVCHAAAGAIILAIQLDKPLVLVPRLKKYNEIIDDHQLQLARALETQHRALVVYEPDAASLQEAISRTRKGPMLPTANSELIQELETKLRQWYPTTVQRAR